jgi:eukaryotic-like serine/threonine-protein kinase
MQNPFDPPDPNDAFDPKDTLRAFGEYVLLARLAKGGMGEVFAARKGGAGGLVCVKILRDEAAQDPALARRFANEAQLISPISHPGVCQVVDAGEVRGTRYLVLEYIPGRPLARLLDVISRMRRVLPPQLSLSVMLDVLDALDFVHGHADPMSGKPLHIVHRDVSPQNIMISIHGEVKLIDFGLASSALDEGIKEREHVFGKVAYMPPEQAAGALVDGRADQFAAAAVLLEMLTGERLYPGLSREQMRDLPDSYMPPSLGALAPDVRAVMEKALSRKAERRFVTCGELASALRGTSIGAPMGRAELRAVVHGLLAQDVLQIQQSTAGWLRKSA